ncbi:MAG: CoA ester lyase [Gammaproteobacteria bacterium]|nr:CoA ester lyase [Gammaproteobacteria bacterium]
MTEAVHPNDALFSGEMPFPVIPTCEHFAGSEKLIKKSFELQNQLGPIFDITGDCEDGAPAGKEREHAEMIVRLLSGDANAHKMAGVRIHDFSHAHWRQDVDILVKGVGEVMAYITIPKTTDVEQLREVVHYIQRVAKDNGIFREIPLHALIETHGALRDVWKITQLPWIQVLDFGVMDFISGHHGAIPASAMRSPGQFEHALLARAKTEIVAAALANGIVPSHNVSLDLKNTGTIYADALRARNEFGFLRMWSIHPSQIQAIVDAMKPEYAEVEDAADILLSAQQANWGPIQYAGELHDRASYRYFWQLLRKAHVTGVKVPKAAKMAFFK